MCAARSRPRHRLKDLELSLARRRYECGRSILQITEESPGVTISGMHVSEIDTPALVVDLDIMERNLARVADYSREHNLRLRPHTKTHKSVRLAKRQIELGAAGLTVAKVGEAEIMLGAQPDDVLVAFPIIGRAKLARLMEVALRTRVTVALDNALAAQALSDAARAAQVE